MREGARAYLPCFWVASFGVCVCGRGVEGERSGLESDMLCMCLVVQLGSWKAAGQLVDDQDAGRRFGFASCWTVTRRGLGCKSGMG